MSLVGVRWGWGLMSKFRECGWALLQTDRVAGEGNGSVTTGINPFAKFVQLHFTVNDFAKQILSLVGADRNKVRTGGCVIVSF